VLSYRIGAFINNYLWFKPSLCCNVPHTFSTKNGIFFKQHNIQLYTIPNLRRKKSSLFPLTSPKKLGTVGRHNFFFLLTLFLFFKESYSFLYCKHVYFCYFYFNWLQKQVKHHYLDELPTKLQYIEKKSQN